MPLMYVELFRVEAKGQKYEFIALDAVSFIDITIITSGKLSHCYFRPACYFLLFNESSVAKI